jgi:hypothetical protein
MRKSAWVVWVLVFGMGASRAGFARCSAEEVAEGAKVLEAMSHELPALGAMEPDGVFLKELAGADGSRIRVRGQYKDAMMDGRWLAGAGRELFPRFEIGYEMGVAKGHWRAWGRWSGELCLEGWINAE